MNVRKYTVVAASLVLAAAASPAYAADHHPGHRSGHDGHHPHHHGHWHHGDHGGGDADTVSQVVALDGPRGVAALGRGRTLVTEADGTFSLVVERRHADPKVIVLGSVPPGAVAPAIAAGHHGEVYVVTGGGPPGGVPGPGGATLYVWHWGEAAPTPVFDVAAYQQGDPDPDNLADEPTETATPSASWPSRTAPS